MAFRRVEPRVLREAFREARVLERLESGELWALVEKDGHPSPPRASEPYCTRSQFLYVYDGLEKIAAMHQYLRPDGKIGASGLPDPKRLVVGEDVLYV